MRARITLAADITGHCNMPGRRAIREERGGENRTKDFETFDLGINIQTLAGCATLPAESKHHAGDRWITYSEKGARSMGAWTRFQRREFERRPGVNDGAVIYFIFTKGRAFRMFWTRPSESVNAHPSSSRSIW